MARYILAVDQSTSATKAILVDSSGEVLSRSSLPHQQFYPNSGFVEHDGQEIYANTVEAMKRCVASYSVEAREIAAIAITNQRETVMVWDRTTGDPLCNAAVWQCLRGEEICRNLRSEGYEQSVKSTTGLVIDPYFSASKIQWILDNVPEARRKAEAGDLIFGTIDSWLVYKLTHGKIHATDFTNACRTLLFDINRMRWSQELFDLFGIPESMAPSLVASDSIVGETSEGDPFAVRVPIAGLMGDSHAALFGEACYRRGSAKATYGTGSSVMMNIGENALSSSDGLVTSIGYALSNDIAYAFEGNVHSTGGTIQWLVEDLGLLPNPGSAPLIATTVDSTEGVYFVPAFVGLGAPYWDNDARALILGMNRSTKKAHIVRAAEESIAYQIRDLIDVMQSQAATDISTLSVDGGGSRDAFLMQFQADILNRKVQCAGIDEVSAMGSAYAAGLAVGLWSDTGELENLVAKGRAYIPAMNPGERNRLYSGWIAAVQKTLSKKE